MLSVNSLYWEQQHGKYMYNLTVFHDVICYVASSHSTHLCSAGIQSFQCPLCHIMIHIHRGKQSCFRCRHNLCTGILCICLGSCRSASAVCSHHIARCSLSSHTPLCLESTGHTSRYGTPTIAE